MKKKLRPMPGWPQNPISETKLIEKGLQKLFLWYLNFLGTPKFEADDKTLFVEIRSWSRVGIQCILKRYYYYYYYYYRNQYTLH